MEIAGWLRGLGLEQYEQAFRENDIDADLLRSLTAEDLREIGIASVGHRRRLLDAIKARRPTRPRHGLPHETSQPAPSGDS